MSVSEIYPYKFTPIYIEKIWGGRSLERLFGRELPQDALIGESWELADLDDAASVVSNGPLVGTTLTELTHRLGQVHPDARAVREIPGAALKTECWLAIDSRGGYIYKGLVEGVSPEQFREGIQSDTVEKLVRRYDLAVGDFHYLPAGTVHAVGPGLVVAEVQTPSDTTYRVTDWGRGREIHVERSMQCIHFTPADDIAPGADGDTLLVTEFFTVSRRTSGPGEPYLPPEGKCVAVMLLDGDGDIELRHSGPIASLTLASPGDTILLPASLTGGSIQSSNGCNFLEITLPENQ